MNGAILHDRHCSLNCSAEFSALARWFTYVARGGLYKSVTTFNERVCCFRFETVSNRSVILMLVPLHSASEGSDMYKMGQK
jgi:hypothetical protein